MRNEGSNLKVGVFYPTKTTGVYFRLRKNGTKTFSARRPDGSRSFEACESLEAAKARRAEFVGKIDKGEVIGNRSRSLNSLIEDWQGLRTTLKPRSREEQDRHVRLHIRPAVGRMKVRDINRAVIKTWLAGLKRKDGKPGPLDDGTKEVILAPSSRFSTWPLTTTSSTPIPRGHSRGGTSPGSESHTRRGFSGTASSRRFLRPAASGSRGSSRSFSSPITRRRGRANFAVSRGAMLTLRRTRSRSGSSTGRAVASARRRGRAGTVTPSPQRFLCFPRPGRCSWSTSWQPRTSRQMRPSSST
jgi:Phage integrase, N-terminal SAM-like domain